VSHNAWLVTLFWGDRVFLFILALAGLAHNPPINPHSWDYRDEPLCLGIGLNRVSLTFYLRGLKP
jgi:hypothetical protein